MRLTSTQVIPAENEVGSSSSTDPLELEFEDDESTLGKPQNRSALTVMELLNPIEPPTSAIQLQDYGSDSESSQSELNFRSKLTNDRHSCESAVENLNEPAMQIDSDSEGPTNLLSQKRPRYPHSSDSDEGPDSSDSSDSTDTHPRKYTKSGQGTSKSAVASRSLRESVKNGSFSINESKCQVSKLENENTSE